jgi:hypothetical protein
VASTQEQTARSAMLSNEVEPIFNRRDVLGGMAGVAAAVSSGAYAMDQAGVGGASQRAPAAETRLPDGATFARWEQPLQFSRTYYVDNAAPQADDAGPGDAARPFRTIGRAAEILQPGERVVIASGVYRECVRPARGGTGPRAMISYEAAPGAKVCIRGSEVLEDGWRRVAVPRAPAAAGADTTAVAVWKHDLTSPLFPDGYNPFALPSIMGSWEWLDTATVDLGPYLRRRGLVFVDGKPLEPMEQLRELLALELPKAPDFTNPAQPQNGLPPRRRGGPTMQEIGGSPTARCWTDHNGTAIYVRLPITRSRLPPASMRSSRRRAAPASSG